MNLEIKQSILLEHLNYAIKGISNKNIIPVLNCIKFDLQEEGLYLLSTDNDIAIKTFIANKDIQKIEKTGQILVSGKFIYEIIRKLPNETIKIEEIIDNKIIIETSQSSFTLSCNNPNEFPELDLKENKDPIILNKKVFKNIIKQTSFASSTQESRPVLTGINFKLHKNEMEINATDSYRVSRKIIEINTVLENDINIIIPTKNLNELVKLIENDEDNLELHIFNNKVIFKFNNLIFMSRLINGDFPDLAQLIPTEYYLSLTMNLTDFYNALDRASLFTNEEDKNTVHLETKQDNKIQLTSNIPEIGNVEEIIEMEKENEKDISISFSSKYMMDALRALECEKIRISFSGEVKPIIIRNVEEDKLLQLIVPIRTY